MQNKKLLLTFTIFLIILPSVLTINASSKDDIPFPWNKNWAYYQEITLPISTIHPFSKFQPIDIHVDFSESCWAKNENEHSVRICSWDGENWYELESQIYDLEYKDPLHITRCGIIFLVPEFANGQERYFVYYHDKQKPSPTYIDHVDVKDDYYYYEPISGVALEGDYYKISEDGFCIYGIGQKGRAINRRLSQAIIKMKPGFKKFDIINSDYIAAFSFAYNIGKADEDQISSDYKLISKQITIDGNLMIQVSIVSESIDKTIRTQNTYKYYYCPTEHKRILIHVKHQVFKESIVRGQVNVDGTYGGLVTYRARGGRNQKLRFGDILPYLHVSGENNQLKEYKINTNPESKEREWIIPYTDDCDIGEGAWISSDQGQTGKSFGLLFSSDKDFVKFGTDERDGIQVKAAQMEYLDVLGSEVDYAGISFGRNSYELGGSHDLLIPEDLTVEYNTEFFSSELGGYLDIIKEEKYFKILHKHREETEDGMDEDKNIYTLTIRPRLSGKILNFPNLANVSGFTILKVWAELYQNNELVSTGLTTRPFLGLPTIKIPKLAAGTYIVKIFRQILSGENKLIGISSVLIEDDKTIDILCTWQQTLKIITEDQNQRKIEDIYLTISKNDTVYFQNTTLQNKDTIFKINYNINHDYTLRALYKGFIFYDRQLPRFDKEIEIELGLYNLEINVKDDLGFNPGVDVRPILTSLEMDIPIELFPEEPEPGRYIFKNLPQARYRLSISYGKFYNEIFLDVPKDGVNNYIDFNANFILQSNIFDDRGNEVENENLKLDIIRNDIVIFSGLSPEKEISLPPGEYTVKVSLDGKNVGEKNIDLTNDKNIKIITKIKSIPPIITTGIIILFIFEILVLFAFKRISLNTFLKLFALGLVILSIFQPWWTLNAESAQSLIEQKSEMFIQPQTMIESISIEGEVYNDIATLPDIFTDFVGTLLLIVFSGIVLLGLSFIPNILLKKRFFVALISASIIFIILVALAFSFGMSKITEISLGSLNGEGPIDIVLPTGNVEYMQATWGLGMGFYLVVIATILLVCTGLIDFIRRKRWPKRFFIINK
jgi:hypothetical protein